MNRHQQICVPSILDDADMLEEFLQPQRVPYFVIYTSPNVSIVLVVLSLTREICLVYSCSMIKNKQL